MDKRLELQALLVDILGSTNVYYQPPESLKMRYPAIVYSRDNIQSAYANNGVYSLSNRYMVTVVDPNPDSAVVTAIAKLPTCKFNHHLVQSELYHDSFTLIF